jgi:hypothetical protein
MTQREAKIHAQRIATALISNGLDSACTVDDDMTQDEKS